ncbi:hypothetical protein WHR41_08297 [Cladosporium halotolerans]|uniref:Ubiquitin-protein ligase E3A N-terminal zinc-binding domain-containing protein n=1 Tax=Cladosporium halotolerans TaxID=1052096 RepID=A0AB34KFX1_9PEZI
MTDTESLMRWSAQYNVTSNPRSKQLPGDKILLPPSALEALLSASANAAAESSRRDLPAYDPFNSASYSAYRQAEAQYEDRRHQLPYPLTFRLVNPDNGRVVYAGIREFSADDEEVVLSSFLLEALGIEGPAGQDGMEDGRAENGATEDRKITVHVKELPKGTFVKLRPLEAGYDPDDWKALLEQHLRQEYTTLTTGEVLVVPGGRGADGKREEFRFLVDGFRPAETDGVCIVDTDLEVDIEALNEEQARETMKRIAAKMTKAPGTEQGSSAGGELDLFNPKEGQVLPGEYVDYELTSWNKSLPLEFELTGDDDEDEVDLIVNPVSARQRAHPRIDEHVFADIDGRPAKRIRLDPTNVELEDAESLYVAVHAYKPSVQHANGDSAELATEQLRHFTLRARHVDADEKMTSGSPEATEQPLNPDEVRCKNCGQSVPQRTLMLHENFCLRNNILCPHGCGQIFQKRSPQYADHWHCPHDSACGNTSLSQQKHNALLHPPEILHCPACSTVETFPSTPSLARHRTTTCPAKLILCRFCHLLVPQEGDPDVPNAEALLSGMTPHELADGARTTECHLCGKIVRLRDMETHVKSHELDRLDRPAPRVCRNVNCGRTLDTCAKNGDTRAGARMGQGAGNDLGLCSVCFGPLYVSLHDPDGKAMRRRIERRYLQQLVSGCGKAWCRNEFCKVGRQARDLPANITMKDGIPMVKPVLDSLMRGETGSPLHFCVDEGSQKRRTLAELLAADETVGFGKGGYGFEWCVGALEAEKGDLEGARKWLGDWAPTRSEERK